MEFTKLEPIFYIVSDNKKSYRFIFFCVSSIAVVQGDFYKSLRDDFYPATDCNGTHFIVIKWSRDSNGLVMP